MSQSAGKDENILERITSLERDLYFLKIDFLKNRTFKKKVEHRKSLFGSVKGGDITDEIIEDSKNSLFRNLKDI